MSFLFIWKSQVERAAAGGLGTIISLYLLSLYKNTCHLSLNNHLSPPERKKKQEKKRKNKRNEVGSLVVGSSDPKATLQVVGPLATDVAVIYICLIGVTAHSRPYLPTFAQGQKVQPNK